MNKRIEELKSQCEMELWDSNPYNGSPEFSGYVLDAEKFAKLIVEECILTIQLKIVRNGPTPENARSHTHINDIKSHFGVEK